MLVERDRLDMLMTDPETIIKEMFPEGDPGSPIPAEFQQIGDYTLNEKGIHIFEIDTKGELEIVTIYPIPFVVHMTAKGSLIFDFFLPETKTVEVESSLEKYLDDTFHSMPGPAKNRIKRYCSTVIMKTWKDH